MWEIRSHHRQQADLMQCKAFAKGKYIYIPVISRRSLTYNYFQEVHVVCVMLNNISAVSFSFRLRVYMLTTIISNILPSCVMLRFSLQLRIIILLEHTDLMSSSSEHFTQKLSASCDKVSRNLKWLVKNRVLKCFIVNSESSYKWLWYRMNLYEKICCQIRN